MRTRVFEMRERGALVVRVPLLLLLLPQLEERGARITRAREAEQCCRVWFGRQLYCHLSAIIC